MEDEMKGLRRDLRVTRIFCGVSLVLVLALLAVGIFLAGEIASLRSSMEPVAEQISELDVEAINELISDVDMEALSETLSQLDVESINETIRRLNPDAINEAIAGLDTEELSRTLANLNDAIDALEDLRQSFSDSVLGGLLGW